MPVRRPGTYSADDFAQKVLDYSKKTVQLIAKNVAGQIFTELSEQVLLTTPVLTGHARHNWQPNIDTPITQEIDGVAGVVETGDELTADENVEIETIVDQFNRGSGTSLHLTNNVPYISFLDAGSSKKAPAGIVQPSIDAILSSFKDRHLKLTK